jgi:hypothetical protein
LRFYRLLSAFCSPPSALRFPLPAFRSLLSARCSLLAVASLAFGAFPYSCPQIHIRYVGDPMITHVLDNVDSDLIDATFIMMILKVSRFASILYSLLGA